jgi:hypothetical protein
VKSITFIRALPRLRIGQSFGLSVLLMVSARRRRPSAAELTRQCTWSPHARPLPVFTTPGILSLQATKHIVSAAASSPQFINLLFVPLRLSSYSNSFPYPFLAALGCRLPSYSDLPSFFTGLLRLHQSHRAPALLVLLRDACPIFVLRCLPLVHSFIVLL